MHTCTIVVPQVFEYNLVLFDRKNINFLVYTKFALKKIDYGKRLLKCYVTVKIRWYTTLTQFIVFKTTLFNASKLGVPNPVKGSHPLIAVNPFVKVPLRPLLLPVTTSLKHSGCLKIKGLIKPKGLPPAFNRASFNLATTVAMTGVAADVPYAADSLPSIAIQY